MDPNHFHIASAISFHPAPLEYIRWEEGRSYSRSSTPTGSQRARSTTNTTLHHRPASPNRLEASSTSVEPDAPPTDHHRRILVGEGQAEDIEGQPESKYTKANDPYALSRGLKTTDEIQNIRVVTKEDTGSRRSSFGLTRGKDVIRTYKVKGFYERQNENINRLLTSVDDHRAEAKKESDSDALQYKIAVWGSFIANVCLAVLQLYGAIASGSLSLFTTMADALFDPLSNLTLLLCHRSVKNVDEHRFPSGKARIETAGNIAFCFLMSAVSFILIALSARDLAAGSDKPKSDFHLPSVIAVGIAFLTKLALFVYCWSLRNKYSQIRILWEDHRNDLLINGFGLLTSVLGSKLRWWIDPMGAIILSCIIVVLWLTTAYKEFQLLIGVSADPAFLQHITYISMTHKSEKHTESRIQAIDTVRAYYSGPRLIVEVDIVMDAYETLEKTHDVAEELQIKLESLPNVERAYVHVDFETDHAPEHFTKKVL